MASLSPRVKELVDSKSSLELSRIYNHLVDLDFKLYCSGKFDYLNHELMMYINDTMYDRYCERMREGY